MKGFGLRHKVLLFAVSLVLASQLVMSLLLEEIERDGLRLAITGSSLLLAIGGAFSLARTITRSVQDLSAAAQRIREGLYGEAVEVRSSDELGELAGRFNEMQQAIESRERQIVREAHHDSLSGLPNRELTISKLRDAIETAPMVGVVSLVLDRFDGIVSSLGPRVGDQVVKIVAGLLRSRIDENQLLGHSGGHEFLLVLPDHDAELALRYVEHLVDLLRAGVRLGNATFSLRASAGIACFPEHGRDAAELCRRASSTRGDALLRHKTVAVYQLGREDRSSRQMKLVGDFPQAIENRELTLSFLPKLDCRTREVYGAEALVRWQHRELGLLGPKEFVGALEHAGCITQLTRWVLGEAAACCGAWRDRGVELSISVNISADDLVDEYLPYFLLDLVKTHRLQSKQLTLEVTESAIMHNVNQSLAVASCIHELGFRLAIDDFGTGQSALTQLKRLPIDELKIDEAFVRGIEDPKDEAVVRTTIELARRLGLDVVAEGVETERLLERLIELGCERAQGYAVGKPLPAEKFLPWLAERRTAKRSGVVAFAPRGEARAGGAVGRNSI